MMKNLERGQDTILITGPTASGKSALAVRLAQAHGGVVVNADSMQVYDTLRVLTARPSEADMDGVPHRLYGHVPAGHSYSTGEWLREVTVLLDQLRAEGRVPIIVGGTGLYFKALTGGLSEMPDVPEEIRSSLRARLQADGPGPLHARLAQVDPEAAVVLKPEDGQRIVRALEIFEASGRSIRSFQAMRGATVVEPDRALKMIVTPDRDELRRRIDRRFETMLDQGAVEEVERLLERELSADLPAMKAIGVPQIAAMLRGEMDRRGVIETASAATRQYAKRQMTWFRNQLDESWGRVAP
ncbi:tRNA (adenosine(37)-N6)-dimethylallyltransferase MiaA [Rhizobium sp. NFR03]|uniref:tRNA (adenosine(37)-N6)-dimethylallyltransferase MiaA n=1 Tax=Rhizobium sp. NFR03 TaxID=1566263 RepID=UPI000B84522E|nr:tRNA (adenosine(37)-N6)-dimethylallyltransferase MiaA [Rhizobium sp. NFR03]